MCWPAHRPACFRLALVWRTARRRWLCRDCWVGRANTSSRTRSCSPLNVGGSRGDVDFRAVCDCTCARPRDIDPRPPGRRCRRGTMGGRETARVDFARLHCVRNWRYCQSDDRSDGPTRPKWTTAATWLILPVVICLSQRLSHACLSTDFYTVKPRMAH